MKIRLLVAFQEEEAAMEHCSRIARTHGDVVEPSPVTLAQTVAAVTVHTPDVLLLGCAAPQAPPLWALVDGVTRASPRTRTLLLCSGWTEPLVTTLIEHGASGYLDNGSPVALWGKAVLAVHRGEYWFPRTELLQALRDELARRVQAAPPPAAAPAPPADEALLTTRERQILGLIGDGLTNKEIARALGISDLTVKTHLHRIYVKLNRSGRYKALMAAPPPGGASSRGRTAAEGARDLPPGPPAPPSGFARR